jgi:hypothetical protein
LGSTFKDVVTVIHNQEEQMGAKTAEKGEKGLKGVSIDFSYSSPKFSFEGDWTGKDVNIIRNLFRREYLRHQQSLRREVTRISNEPGGTNV